MAESVAERLQKLEAALADARRGGGTPQALVAIGATRLHDDILAARLQATPAERGRVLALFHASRRGLRVTDRRGRLHVTGAGDASMRHTETLAHPGASIHVAGAPARERPTVGDALDVDRARRELALLAIQ